MSDEQLRRRHEDDVVARSDALDERLAEYDVPAQIHELAKRADRYELVVKALAVSLVFDLVLSFVVWRVAFTARDASRRAISAQAHARLLCLSGNESRAQQVELWETILTMSAQSPREETPAQAELRKRQSEQFRAYLSTVFRPRDCTHPESPRTEPRTVTTTGVQR